MVGKARCAPRGAPFLRLSSPMELGVVRAVAALTAPSLTRRPRALPSAPRPLPGGLYGLVGVRRLGRRLAALRLRVSAVHPGAGPGGPRQLGDVLLLCLDGWSFLVLRVWCWCSPSRCLSASLFSPSARLGRPRRPGPAGCLSGFWSRAPLACSTASCSAARAALFSTQSCFRTSLTCFVDASGCPVLVTRFTQSFMAKSRSTTLAPWLGTRCSFRDLAPLRGRMSPPLCLHPSRNP